MELPESDDRLEIRPLYRVPQLENLAVDGAEGKPTPFSYEVSSALGLS